MVSQILTLLALAASPPTDPGTGARVEALARATILRGITLRPAIVTLRVADAAPPRQVNRRCDAPDTIPRQCRLIVVDLP